MEAEYLPDLVGITSPSLLPFTQLYPLAPIGIGSAQVESLGSYVARLAWEHSVAPEALVRHILGFNHAQSIRRTSVNSVSRHLGVDYFAGMSSSTQRRVDVLETVTGQSNLAALTALRLGKTLSAFSILRYYAAWCPVCLTDDIVPYGRLLWEFECVDACPVHDLNLVTRCPRCRSSFGAFVWRGRPGFCPYCRIPVSPLRRYKGAKVDILQDAEKRLAWARSVGELITFLASRTPSKDRWGHVIDTERVIRFPPLV